MTPIHTLWTGARKPSKIDMTYMRLSALMAIEAHGTIDLVTDKKGLEIVRKANIPYSNTYVELDDVEKEKGFPMAKIKSYLIASQKNENYFHIDTDVFLHKPVKKTDYLVQCDEGRTHYTYSIFKELLKRGHSSMYNHKDEDLRFYNMGIFKAPKEFVSEYFDVANTLYEKNKNIADDFMRDQLLMFIEQNTVYMIAKSNKIKFKEHYPLDLPMHNIYDWGMCIDDSFKKKTKKLANLLNSYSNRVFSKNFETPGNILAGKKTGYTHLVHFKSLKETEADVLGFYEQYTKKAIYKTHKETVDELNSMQNYYRKFSSIMEVDLPYTKSKIKFKESEKLCVVYACWNYEGFLKFAYVSILCQIMNTDITDFDIRIFISEDLKYFAIPLLSPLIGREKIIIVQNGLCYKHGISTHPKLKDFEVLSFCDTDAFVFSRQKKAYQELYDYHIENNKNALCFIKINHNAIDGKAMFEKRVELSNSDYSKDFNDDLLPFGNPEKYWDFIENEQWPWSCHFSVHGDFLKKPKVKSYILNCLQKEIKCDETVWFSALIVSGYNLLSINDANWIESVSGFDFEKWENTDGFVHPIQFKEYENAPKVREMLREIIQKY